MIYVYIACMHVSILVALPGEKRGNNTRWLSLLRIVYLCDMTYELEHNIAMTPLHAIHVAPSFVKI